MSRPLSDRAQARRTFTDPAIARRRSMLAALLWSWRHIPAPAGIQRLIARERLEVLGRRTEFRRRAC